MNGSQGIQPVVELATNGNNGFAYPYPVMPMMGGYGNSGFGGYGSDWIWVILLLALFGGNWGGNGNGGFFGGNSFDNGFAWLSNGQKEIMNNTNNGFDTLHLSNQVEGVRDGIYSLSNQLCNCCSDMNQTVNSGFAGVNQTLSNGFYNAEVSACNRQMANMNQNYANQISTLQSFNGLERQLCECCADNRLATQDLKSTVISENCTDREVIREIGQNILVNQTENTNRIISELFKDRLDEKNEKISDLQRQLQMADLRASQIAQTAQLRADNVASNEALLNSLNTCPIPSTPVYGRTPIFSCNNNGCGCNGYNNLI